MYAGISFVKYASVLVISAVSMMAGSQLVHQLYKPLDDLEDYVEREIQKRKTNNAYDK